MQITFNGQQYSLSVLASLGGFGHKLRVQTAKLKTVPGSENDTSCKMPVVCEFSGDIYVLAGRVDQSASEIDVMVISKHTLKKASAAVQSQPIDTKPLMSPPRYVKEYAQEATTREPRHNNRRVSDDKTRAALAALGGNTEPRKPTIVSGLSDKAKAALAVLERAANRV